VTALALRVGAKSDYRGSTWEYQGGTSFLRTALDDPTDQSVETLDTHMVSWLSFSPETDPLDALRVIACFLTEGRLPRQGDGEEWDALMRVQRATLAAERDGARAGGETSEMVTARQQAAARKLQQLVWISKMRVRPTVQSRPREGLHLAHAREVAPAGSASRGDKTGGATRAGPDSDPDPEPPQDARQRRVLQPAQRRLAELPVAAIFIPVEGAIQLRLFADSRWDEARVVHDLQGRQGLLLEIEDRLRSLLDQLEEAE
jgi:hypothetical protein